MNTRFSKLTCSLRRGFTLVELLVVVAIIGILAGLIIPAVAGALTKAKLAEIRTQFSQLATSLENFKGQYGYFPSGIFDGNGRLDVSTAAGEDFYECMEGIESSGTVPGGNRKKIKFYSFPEDMVERNATGAYTAFKAPLDGVNGPIIICIDHDGDGLIETGLSGDNATINASVGIYSLASGGTGEITHDESVATWDVK